MFEVAEHHRMWREARDIDVSKTAVQIYRMIRKEDPLRRRVRESQEVCTASAMKQNVGVERSVFSGLMSLELFWPHTNTWRYSKPRGQSSADCIKTLFWLFKYAASTSAFSVKNLEGIELTDPGRYVGPKCGWPEKRYSWLDEEDEI